MLNSLKFGLGHFSKSLPSTNSMAPSLAIFQNMGIFKFWPYLDGNQAQQEQLPLILNPTILGMPTSINFGFEDWILGLSTFKRKKLKIKKDRASTIRKRLKRKSLRKRARYQLD